MKYLAMIQARCGSSRFPNKVMMDLYGKPELQRVIERVQKSRFVDEVMVITSIDKNNLPILRLCADIGIRAGVGSEDDVLDRYYQYARLLKPEYVIRITADCPCFDAGLLDEAIVLMDDEADYLAMISEEFADGLDLEILKYSALERSWKEAARSFEREHVTQYIRRHPEIFKLQDFKSPVGNFGNHRWTVDEPEDFEVVKRIYGYFFNKKHREDFTYKEILNFLTHHPDIMAINQKFQRNEGLKKSMEEDKIEEH